MRLRRKQEGFVILNPFWFGFVPPSDPDEIDVDAADFSGASANNLSRASGFTGAAASKNGILSIWLKPDVLDSDDWVLRLASAGSDIMLFMTRNAGSWRLSLADTTGTILLLEGQNGDLVTTDWNHVLISWDVSVGTSATRVYINDEAVTLGTHTVNDRAFQWQSVNDARVSYPFQDFNGGLAELYLAPGQYLDFDTESNRRKYISAGGKPVDLGSDGSLPTGTVPLIYLHLDDAESSSNFGLNRSGAGDFTVNGTVPTYPTSPSDDPAFLVDAADFDGSNDYMQKLSTFTGAADSKQGTLVFWAKPDAIGSVRRVMSLNGVSAGSLFLQYVDGAPQIQAAAGVPVLNASSADSNAAISTSEWRCFMWSWDATVSGLSGIQCYQGDTACTLSGDGIQNDQAVLYSAMDDNYIGSDEIPFAFLSAWNGGLAELWFMPGVAIDFSVEANRRKFYSSTGKPVDLGSDGSTPTGSAPMIYLHLDDAESAANFGTNRAGTGDFTVVGALTTYPSSPSD